MLYELSVKSNQINAQGVEKEVKERFICDCELFAEAETKGLELYDTMDCDVVDIKRSKIMEIINKKENDKDSFFKAKIVSIFVNDDGVEKEQKYYILLYAIDIKQATERALEYLKQGLTDMRLDAINKTNILDIL